MAFRCNIDRRGRLARLIYGIAVAAVALYLTFKWAIGAGSLFRWVVCLAVMFAGAFAIFEAIVGWCAVRAMGVRTPI
jgi:hypothetical protein